MRRPVLVREPHAAPCAGKRMRFPYRKKGAYEAQRAAMTGAHKEMRARATRPHGSL